MYLIFLNLKLPCEYNSSHRTADKFVNEKGVIQYVDLPVVRLKNFFGKGQSDNMPITKILTLLA